jgi:hypothetical protein
MSRTLNGLTAAALAAWSFYLLYVLAAILRLPGWFPASELIPVFAIPITMIAAALWIRLWLAARLKGRKVALAQFFIFAAACLFLASVLMPRA